MQTKEHDLLKSDVLIIIHLINSNKNQRPLCCINYFKSRKNLQMRGRRKKNTYQLPLSISKSIYIVDRINLREGRKTQNEF